VDGLVDVLEPILFVVGDGEDLVIVREPILFGRGFGRAFAR